MEASDANSHPATTIANTTYQTASQSDPNGTTKCVADHPAQNANESRVEWVVVNIPPTWTGIKTGNSNWMSPAVLHLNLGAEEVHLLAPENRTETRDKSVE